MAKVLLAEGDPALARALSDAFVTRGHQSSAVSDGLQVLPSARRDQPDAIVLDAVLPGGGGPMLVERLRSNATTAAIPVVVVGGEASEQEFVRAGAHAVVKKSAAPDEAVTAVESAISPRTAPLLAPATVMEQPGRLEALRQTGLVDSPIEEDFDRFTRLVSRLLRVPVALISLVTDNRQFFKSAQGLDEPWSSRRETPLSHSFCQFAVTFREPLVIDNAQLHPLVKDNLAIPELGVAAYAGVPLIDGADHAIGSLCAIDSKPRPWSADDIDALRDVAGILMRMIELHAAARG